MSVPASRTDEVINERRGIGADTAERLARYFDGDSVSCLSVQAT